MSDLNSELARDLLEATRTRVPVPRLTTRFPQLTVDDAYEIQTLQLRAHEKAGRVLIGRKVGLTSKAMQDQLGVDSPDFGFFFEDMLYTDGAKIPVGQFVSPKVEPEFAFILGTDLQGPGVTLEAAAQAIAHVHPAIEIIDSRIADWDIGLVDTIADNASCGAIVIGEHEIDVEPLLLSDLECTLRVDGEPIGVGRGDAVMGHPVAPLAWLANVLGERGVGLRAGDAVLPGALMAAAAIPVGVDVTADFGANGSLTIAFSD
ncbi:MAG: 2-keto-4-pentenoate hydratase [Microbacteriaceae bacterium]|jgi:2-keto-4-pentenoate hydratase|nr:2-keto-4-pentenoate hydratase [Microbacteriaceae bacterium]